MVFKGRTVLAFILIAMFASSIITVTFIGAQNGGAILAKDKSYGGKATNQPIQSAAANSGADKTANGLTQAEMDKINTAYQLIENKFYHSVDREKILDGAIHGMIASLDDPFSTYMTKEETKQYEENVNSFFTGIGAEVTMVDGRVTVMSPIKGSPAEKAGVLPNDIILSVNGEKLDGLKLTDAVMKIRGPKGTQAQLSISRAGMKEAIKIIVVRDNINIETVEAKMLDQQIGLITISQFSGNTVDRFKQELTKLENKGMKGLIIDVRNNPGGYLYGVLEIINPLVPKGKTLVQVEYRDQQTEKTQSKGPGKDYPIVVLTNQGSASASEIMAAALRESAGATLIGEKTFGKGTVQTTYEKELGDGSNIKMTIAKWLTPDGSWIHQKGIEPDFTVSQPDYFKVAPLNKEKPMMLDTTGDQIENLQLMLKGVGLSPGRTDGYFDVKTEQAVKAFQHKNQLAETGIVDAKTAGTLEQQIIKAIRDPRNDLQLQRATQFLENKIAK